VVVGFCGSRSLAPTFAPLVGAVVGRVVAAGGSVVVGCAAGADQFVRSAALGAVVFSVASGQWGRGRGAFAGRSAALVRHVAAVGPSCAALVGFVSSPCPVGVVPGQSWSVGGSGSWSSLALAAGLGLPVYIFWCAPGAFVPPSWLGAFWSPVASGLFAGSWVALAASVAAAPPAPPAPVVQLPLF